MSSNAAEATNGSMNTSFDPLSVRSDFPILSETTVNGKPLTYLDNAATTQKPQCVIDTISRYYTRENANIHRGVHTLSAEATAAYEGARETVRAFLGAEKLSEIIFTSGTTDSINLLAHSLTRLLVKPGDEILITELEHHSNIVPWQIAAELFDAKLIVAPINDRGEIILDSFVDKLNERTRIVSIAHVSNALGTINPIAKMIELAHDHGAKVIIDGAQAVAHLKVDVNTLDCDFYAFSGHKIFGPTGTGVLFGREDLLEQMPPYRSGGDMINEVSFDKTTYNDLPYKFEAGTPNIAGNIGLGKALEYVSTLDLEALSRYENELLEVATERLLAVGDVRLLGTASNKASVLSFNIEGVHAHDLGMLLDHQGVAIRTGHHCAMPVMAKFGLSGTARASFAMYNNLEDVERFCDATATAMNMLS